MKTFLTTLILIFTSSIVPLHAAATGKPLEQLVRDYVEACNKRDLDLMMKMVTEDIEWLSVTGDKVSVETKGKPQLQKSMASYFKSTPTAKSELEWTKATSARVAALEKASWQSKAGPKSQSSLSVYEFRDGLIARVYYYPVEK